MRSVLASSWLLATLSVAACGGSEPGPASIRLVDAFGAATLEGTPEITPQEPIQWGFADPATGASTLAFRALNDIADLQLRDGLLVGRSTGIAPLLHLAIPEDAGLSDQLHALHIRMRVNAGGKLGASWAEGEDLEEEEVLERTIGRTNSPVMADLSPGEEMVDYELSAATAAFVSLQLGGVRHLMIRPTDVGGAEFAIESVRIESRREHLASIPSGIGWQGLGEVYRETLVTRAPERVRFELDVPAQPWLELNLGTIEQGPVTFRVSIGPEGQEQLLLERTVSTPDRWSAVPVDLEPFAGRHVLLTLGTDADSPGAIAYWGTPVVRNRNDATRVIASVPAREALTERTAPPRGVIFILMDTLRRDRLPWYGGQRDNAPVLARLAEQGTVFTHDVSQASWTKVSVPSILTSLYASTHGLIDLPDRLPASVTTLEELFLQAGYATFHTSSVPFTGKLSNLHQGVEVLHEVTSVPEAGYSSSKTARTYVDRLLEWLDGHADTPFFVFLHAFDPHSPFEPYPPYDTLYTDEGELAEQQRRVEAVSEHIADEHMRRDMMPLAQELAEAEVDADAFVDTELDWYDGSIRAADVEIGRILERLRQLDLDQDTLIVFMSDHGEEFLEHGRHFHGYTTYGEMLNVPLMLWWPGVVPAARVDDLVESIDVYPTVLQLARIAVPEQAQGQSLLPLLADPAAPTRFGWLPRPAFSERVRIPSIPELDDRETDSYVIVADVWKLIRNTRRPEGWPEYELYAYYDDPLDQHDVAAEHPDIVESMAAELDDWLQMALAAKVEDGGTEGLSPEEISRLRSLGYIQ